MSTGAYAKLGGVAVSEARVSFPRVGAWMAELRVDTDALPAGQLALELGGNSFVGTVSTGRVYEATAHVRVVGGAGGLKTVLPAKGYINSPIVVPLGDIARETGETLAKSCDSTITNALLRHWARIENRGGTALALLIEEMPAAVWRFLADGSLWVGEESWPAANQSEVELIGYSPLRDSMKYFSPNPGTVRPGTTFLNRQVSYVEHLVSSEGLTSTAWFEREGG